MNPAFDIAAPSPPFASTRRFAFLGGGFLLLVVALLGWPLLFAGKTLSGGDIVNHYLPLKFAAKEQMARGEFPHWNPWIFCGRPLQADVQVGLFYPPNLLFWILPLEWAFDLTALFHLWIGAWGMALWVGRRVRRAAPALLAGALFMLGGFSTTRLGAGIVVFHAAMAWTPWLLYAWDALLDASRRGAANVGRRVAALVIVASLAILSGAPQITFYSFGALALYVLVKAWRPRRNRQSDGWEEPYETSEETPLEEWGGLLGGLLPLRPGPVLALAGVLLLSGAICAVQILPTNMFISQSWDRATGGEWDYIVDGSFEPRMLLTFVAPFFFGDPKDEATYWGGTAGYHETTAYCGALPILLVLLFILVRWGPLRRSWLSGLDASERRDAVRFEIFLLLLLAVAALFAWGRHSPFFWLAYHLVPGFDRFRVPARLLLYAVFAGAALSGWALDRVMEERPGSGGPAELSEEDRSRSPAAVLAALWIAGLACVVMLWRATPVLTHLMEMPFHRLADGGDRGAGQIAQGLIAQARRSVAYFGFQWCLCGLLVACALPPLPRRPKNSSPHAGSARRLISRDAFRTAAAPATRRAGLWLLTALCLADLLVYEWHFLETKPRARLRRLEYPNTPRTDFLREKLATGGRFLWFDTVQSWQYDQNQPELHGNRPVMYRLPGLRGYDPVNSRRFGLFMNQITRRPLFENPGGFMMAPDLAPENIDWRLIRLWDCRVALSYNVLESPSIEEAGRWEFPSPAGLQVLRAYRMKDPAGPARLCEPFFAPPESAPEEIARLLSHPEFDVERFGIVAADPFAAALAEGEAGEESAKGLERSVRLVEANSGSLVFEVSTPARALLVVAQSWYPGWRARVDGRKSAVIPANLAQCGVGVPAGRHRVELRYRPREFRQGAVASLAGLALLGLIVLRLRERENVFG